MRAEPARLGALACLIVALALTPPAQADDAVAAGQHFKEGEAAFQRHDYVAAGTEFDAAYAASPHESSLFNAALSWEKAGELARAANLYRRYLRVAPADASDRAKAAGSVAELSKRLGKLDVVRDRARDVRLDGRPLDEDALFTTPGEHSLAWTAEDGAARSRVVTVALGETASVVLGEPEKPSLPPTVRPADPPPPGPPPAATRSGITPWVAIALGGTTVVSGAVLLWSGIDVLQAKSDYDQQKKGLSVADQRTLIDDGKARTDRTNVIVGVTGALGVATVISLIFTDFHAFSRETAPGVSARIGPGSVGLLGSF
ncbi:MAG: hypothetical protein U0414_15180 [Polyangiaceae bacterium]